MHWRVCVSALLVSFTLAAAEFRAGLARVNITPDTAIWLSGYAARKHPSEGIAGDLFAKALALEDKKKNRVVIVTTDLIGLPRAITDEVAARVQKQYGLERSHILFNSSHTHAGPVVRPNLITMYNLDAGQSKRVEAYSRELAEDLFNIIGAAVGDLAPAELAFGQGTAGFAVNRREFTDKGVKLGVNAKGPVDHSVPVLRVKGADGRLRAILYGYACHNTTLGGDYYKVNGDYAGYSQAELENRHPGATALFMELCGGDQNPNPRGTEKHVEDHGKALAATVEQALAGQFTPVRSPIRSAYQVTELYFGSHTRETFEQEAKDSNPAKVRRAQAMLKLYDERAPLRRTPYPVQAIRFNKDLTLLALGGEVVVDYALRTKKEHPKERLIVAGYSNDVMCYIPTLRVLKEGGYEPETSMIYYGMPGAFREDVEDLVVAAVRQVLRRVGAK